MIFLYNDLYGDRYDCNHCNNFLIFRQLTDAEKLRKVVVELVDTERTYVKHLSYLMQVFYHQHQDLQVSQTITIVIVIKIITINLRPTWSR